jgi:hypothetical protein
MWILIIVAGLQLAATYHLVDQPRLTPDGEVCYRLPYLKSEVGDQPAASSSLSSGSPMERVDYSLPAPKELK